MRPSVLRRWASLALVAGLALSTACRTSDGQHRLISTVESPQLTEAQLRARLYDFVGQFSGEVAAAANEMVAQATSDDVRRIARTWKANGIPACQAAAFDQDPVIGLIDVWALVVQIGDYFESDRAVERLGDARLPAHATMARLEDQIEAIAAQLGTERSAADARLVVHEFAGRNPVDDLRFTRASATPELRALTAAAQKSVFHTVESLDERMDDLSDRMTIYAATLPKQARWEAEIFTDYVFHQPEIEAVTSLAAEFPALIAEERKLILAAIRDERAVALADLERQRLETIETLERERRTVLGDITDQRVAILEFVGSEREAMVTVLAAEREALIAELRAQREAAMEEIDRQRAETLNVLREEREAVLAWAENQRAVVIDDIAERARTTADDLLERAFLYLLALVAIPCVLLAVAIGIGRGRVLVDLSRRE